MYARDVKSKLHSNESIHLEKGTGNYFDFMVREHFGNKIREYRNQLHFTREAFASDFNKEMNPESPMKIYNLASWESGESFPKPKTLVSLYVYFSSKKGIPCDFNDFLMFDGLKQNSSCIIDGKQIKDLNTNMHYRLLTIPYGLLDYFDRKKVLLEIKNVLFPAIVDVLHRRLIVTDADKDYPVSFIKVQQLKVYHLMNHDNEISQSAKILSLTEAKSLPHVYISWLDQKNPDFAEKISGYYSYVPTLKAFTNSQMDIHLNELNYLKTYVATTDFK